ncbi:MAG TPA: polysaccharide biosynthesis protein, partial [Terriglobales bacterium]|nr:polysaccharide biosynthesis protein [Terriglobales bacterium]
LAPDCETRYLGIRPGEKLHEVLVSEDEARNTLELDDMFVIQPAHSWWKQDNWKDARPLPDGFRYASDNNPRWMDSEELLGLIQSAPVDISAQRQQRLA